MFHQVGVSLCRDLDIGASFEFWFAHILSLDNACDKYYYDYLYDALVLATYERIINRLLSTVKARNGYFIRTRSDRI